MPHGPPHPPRLRATDERATALGGGVIGRFIGVTSLLSLAFVIWCLYVLVDTAAARNVWPF